MIHQICCRLHKFRWQHLHTSTHPHNPNWTQSRPSRESSRPCKMIIKIIITVRVTSKTVPVNRKYTKHLKSFDILNVIQNNAYHSTCKRVNPVLYRLSIKIDFFCWSDWPPPENKETLSLPECLLCMCVYVCVRTRVCTLYGIWVSVREPQHASIGHRLPNHHQNNITMLGSHFNPKQWDSVASAFYLQLHINFLQSSFRSVWSFPVFLWSFFFSLPFVHCGPAVSVTVARRKKTCYNEKFSHSVYYSASTVMDDLSS